MKRKVIKILIALIVYLSIGFMLSKFLTDSNNKPFQERNVVEKVITLDYLKSNVQLAEEQQRNLNKQTWEEKSWGDKIAESFYFPIFFPIAFTAVYLLALLWYIKWIIAAVLIIALYSNFGHWLGGYVYEKSIHDPNLLTKFLEIPKNFPFNWKTAVNNDWPTKELVEIGYAIIWPLFIVIPLVTWIMFIIYKIIQFIWWIIKSSIWLMMAGPARKNPYKLKD